MLRIAAIETPTQTNIRLTRRRPDRAGSRHESADLVPMLNCELPKNGQRVTEFAGRVNHSYFAARAARVLANLTSCRADKPGFTSNDR